MTDIEKTILNMLAENKLNVSEVARNMPCHRNTVVYHIDKIKQKTGKNPLNVFDLVELIRYMGKGCDWCNSLKKKNIDFSLGDMMARNVVEHTFYGDGKMYSQLPKFCPICGCKLEMIK